MKYPLFIKWAITNECNLRCKHCYLGEYKNNIDYINEFINLKRFIEFDFLRFELYIPVINRFDELALSHDDINKIRCIFNSLKKDTSVILPKFNSEIMCGAGIVNCMINPDRTIFSCNLLSCEIKSQMKIDAEHTLKDIWNNDPVLVQWRNNMLKGLRVKGGCRASALKYNNNMISEDPLLLLYGNENDD